MNSEFREIEIMRHAESLEDVDKTAYERVSDEEMPLTEGGRAHFFITTGKYFLLNAESNLFKISISYSTSSPVPSG